MTASERIREARERQEVSCGYGVAVLPIWAGEEEGDGIADVEVEVVRITDARFYGGHLGYAIKSNNGDFYYKPSNFQPLEDLWEDDTHDLRDRWFATRKEAEEHAEFTLKRWKHPQPWESFVKL